MPVTMYKSTDASAPVLTGQVGSLVALLDACLVNGYSGKSAAGWSKAYSGTNAASYRMATSGNTGFYLDINDNGPGAAGARESRARGYEVMTALATGTGPFPTTAQMANGVFIRKSTTADATARAWTLIADSATFYLFTETGDQTTPVACCTFMFGDFTSYKTADAYRCMIIGRQLENQSGTSLAFSETSVGNPTDTLMQGLTISGTTPNQLSTSIYGHYIARNHTGTGGSIPCGKHTDLFKSSTLPSSSGTNNPFHPFGAFCNANTSFPYPNASDGGLYTAPIWLHHSGTVRGHMRGLWSPLHALPLGHNDTFSGSGPMTGKTFIAMAGRGAWSATPAYTQAQVFLETSDTWS